jgi:hypothetical protein
MYPGKYDGPPPPFSFLNLPLLLLLQQRQRPSGYLQCISTSRYTDLVLGGEKRAVNNQVLVELDFQKQKNKMDINLKHTLPKFRAPRQVTWVPG